MVQIFKRWYEGKTKIHHFDQDENAGIYVFPFVYVERHWTAQAARWLTAFCLRHWQFIIGTIIAIVLA